jgi:hypothetical protein
MSSCKAVSWFACSYDPELGRRAYRAIHVFQGSRHGGRGWWQEEGKGPGEIDHRSRVTGGCAPSDVGESWLFW